ncbi:poly-beta-1,6 N-acetyl-D-glucosamine export porin PgaA [Acidovorax sp. NPDC077693]|uniref:poly-beta-1,6 N-acetyl-D-glucosamine export porin PgaA n=1 Tax=unclassified Acidovorax TaxID=2684926 RepID=UPI0037C83A1E
MFGNPFPSLSLPVRPAFHAAVAAGAMACALAYADTATPVPVAESYDALVRRARTGDTTPVLDYLRQERLDRADAARLVADWIDIAGWARLDQEVVDVYRRHGASLTLPVSTLASVARAHRNLRQWDDALALYARALARSPDDAELRMGEIHVLSDAGRDADARTQAEALVAETPMVARRRLALAYVHTAARRFHAALAEASRARSLAPDDAEVQMAYADALQSAGLPVQAQALVDAQPALMGAAQQRRLQADIGAEMVRLSFAPVRSESERFAVADKALAFYEQVFARWSADPQAVRDLQRMRIDRIGALTVRSRMDTAVAEYEALRRDGVPVPDYALRWVAGAYLYLRQAQAARLLYAELLERSQADPSVSSGDASGLFYSLVESEAMDAAVSLADGTQKAFAATPAGRAVWASAAMEAAQAHSFSDDTPEAQLRLERMVQQAPGHLGARIALAGVYRGRAWPRRAEQELKLVEAMEPRALSLELQQGFTAMDLQEWKQADALADDVLERYPENLQVQRLDRTRRVFRMPELRVSGYRGLSSSPNPSTGNGDYGTDTVLYSAPVRDDWRLFAGFGFGSGDFREGRGVHRSYRAGGEWRVRDNTVEGEISTHNFGYGQRTGLRLEGRHDLSDQWQISGAAERLSRDTPLRALRSDITADSVTAALRWRANERRDWNVSVGGLDYSDGNRRLSVGVAGRERIYTRYGVYADLVMELSHSRNSRPGGPYFAPESDVFLLPTLDVAHVLYRHYQLEWRQRLQLGVGAYAQRGYGVGEVATLGYGQRLRVNDTLEMGLSFSITRRPYDGVDERILRTAFDLLYRF